MKSICNYSLILMDVSLHNILTGTNNNVSAKQMLKLQN